MAAEAMEPVAYRMVAPVGLDPSKVMDMTGWNKMVAGMTIEEPVMAAAPTELHKPRHSNSALPILQSNNGRQIQTIGD